MSRTYRVIVTGRFADLNDQQKTELRGQLDEHDYTTAAHTPEGTFVYSEALTRFTLRYLLTSDEMAVQADEDITFEAELLATEYLADRGLQHGRLDVTFTCLEDIKLRTRR